MITACKNQGKDNKDSKSKGITENVSIDTKNNDFDEQADIPDNLKNFKTLAKILSTNDTVFQKFQTYIEKLQSNPTSESEILNILKMRDDLNQDISDILDQYYYENEDDYETWDKVDDELMKCGYSAIYVEGMFVGLGRAEMLTDAINKYCSEPTKLQIKYKATYESNIGGEYPYADPSSFFETFKTGEELYTKYTETEAYKEIEIDFMELLRDFTDIHKVNTGAENSFCCVFDFNNDYYPYQSDCELPELFIKEMPNSIFVPIFKALQENMSTMNVDDKTEYVIAIETYDEYNDALKALFEYQTKGTDVVHIIKIKKDDDIKFMLAYRFYNDKTTAEENLAKVKEKIDSAKIVEIKIIDTFEPVEIVD